VAERLRHGVAVSGRARNGIRKPARRKYHVFRPDYRFAVHDLDAGYRSRRGVDDDSLRARVQPDGDAVLLHVSLQRPDDAFRPVARRKYPPAPFLLRRNALLVEERDQIRIRKRGKGPIQEFSVRAEAAYELISLVGVRQVASAVPRDAELLPEARVSLEEEDARTPLGRAPRSEHARGSAADYGNVEHLLRDISFAVHSI
jgi:hypothetical protein